MNLQLIGLYNNVEFNAFKLLHQSTRANLFVEIDPFRNSFPEVIEETLDEGYAATCAFNRRGNLLATVSIRMFCISIFALTNASTSSNEPRTYALLLRHITIHQ